MLMPKDASKWTNVLVMALAYANGGKIKVDMKTIESMPDDIMAGINYDEVEEAFEITLTKRVEYKPPKRKGKKKAVKKQSKGTKKKTGKGKGRKK